MSVLEKLNLSTEEMIQIRNEYFSFEREGHIGECLLRSKAEEYMKITNIPPHMVVFTMNLVFGEINRYFADLFLSKQPNSKNFTSSREIS